MDIARQQIKKNTPACVVQHTLRTLMTAPAPVARYAVYDLTRPTGSQKKWIKYFDNQHWKGALIAPDIKKDNEHTALERLKNADLVIYEIHGGGFRVGHCLAPKVYYPAPIQTCVSGYQYLTTELGVSPTKIIISGDSAGGIISLEMLCHIYAPGLLTDPYAKRTNFDIDLPAGILLSSPVISVNQTSESWKKYASSDIVSHRLFDLVIKEYVSLKKNNLDKMAMFNLFNNLSHGGMEQICQGTILIFVGEKEVFRDDIITFVDIIKKTTSKLKVNVCKAQYAHDWYLIREIVRQEDKELLHRCDTIMAKWCDRALVYQRKLKQQAKDRKEEQRADELSDIVSTSLGEKVIPPHATTLSDSTSHPILV
ncbi:Alpha/Beta hydrolase protein [Halteromyces radiatus]|uniref:Alpha/Beta hydrolase protein n=1 Tax=Halteromyces radiatus TaxID=101107 RepID=UPI002220BD1E|nr:Alpha/Beta hydrolase protein [Halteromyces radiatus]KAI8084751.1 Alpha/Beta hydrolase protein [Halteromyces radiatus]